MYESGCWLAKSNSVLLPHLYLQENPDKYNLLNILSNGFNSVIKCVFKMKNILLTLLISWKRESSRI